MRILKLLKKMKTPKNVKEFLMYFIINSYINKQTLDNTLIDF